MRTISEWLRAHGDDQPDRTALMAPSRASLSYRSLANEVASFGQQLAQRGIAPTARVAVVLLTSAEAMVALLATMSYCTCAPLNPALTASEFEFEFDDLGIAAIVVDSSAETAAVAVAERRGIQVITLPPRGKVAGQLGAPSTSAAPAVPSPPPSQIALVLHTSGTTAKPKIVPLTHEMLSASATGVVDALALTASDRYLSLMPLYHIHGLATLFGAIAAGCTVIAPTGFDPLVFWQTVEESEPTWYSAAPTIHQAILRRAAELPTIPKTRLRLVRSASAALPVSTIQELERVFKVPVIEFYGMTEASDQICTNPLPPGARKPGSVGLPLVGVELAIADPQGGFIDGQDQGEVLIRGGMIITAYENNPGANTTSFRDGWFCTGDLGRRDADGYLYLTGRSKEVINRGGEKISPREVDEVLMRHPAIDQVVTFALPHGTLGEAVAAAVVLRAGATATERELRAFAREVLAEFKVPQQVIFVDQIPKGPTGKLQRIGLADKFAGKFRADFVPPRDALEEAFAAIWADVLNLERVGVTDNYFSIGGDSLNAAIIFSKSQRLGVGPEVIFTHPTIAEIVAAHRESVGPEQAQDADRAAETFLQELAAAPSRALPSDSDAPKRTGKKTGVLRYLQNLWRR